MKNITKINNNQTNTTDLVKNFAGYKECKYKEFSLYLDKWHLQP